MCIYLKVSLSEFLEVNFWLQIHKPGTHLTAFILGSHAAWPDVWFLSLWARDSTGLVVFCGPLTL